MVAEVTKKKAWRGKVPYVYIAEDIRSQDTNTSKGRLRLSGIGTYDDSFEEGFYRHIPASWEGGIYHPKNTHTLLELPIL